MGQRGFGLIEVVLAIAMVGILLALATQDFARYLRKAKVEREAKELYAEIQATRSQAAFTKVRQSVAFSGQQVVFRSYSSDADVAGKQIASKKVPVGVSTNWAAPSMIQFDTKGTMTDPGTIKVICIPTTDEAAFDAVIVTPVTTTLGKVTNRGAACALSNVVQK